MPEDYGLVSILTKVRKANIDSRRSGKWPCLNRIVSRIVSDWGVFIYLYLKNCHINFTFLHLEQNCFPEKWFSNKI